MPEAARRCLWVLGVGVLLSLPWWASSYHVHVAALIGVFVIVGVGMNILVGYSGLVSLGHAGLFAVGAYTSALLSTRLGWGFWVPAVAALVVAGFAGGVLALTSLRARGIYLAMITVAFGIIVEQVALDQAEFTGGFMGISNIPPPAIAGWTFTRPFRLYLILAVAGASLVLARNLRHSRWGRGLLAVRENRIAAESLGVGSYRMESTAFILSASLTGLAGSLYAHQNAFIAPNIFTFDLSVLMLLMVILGGLGTTWGPAVGATVLLVLPEIIAGFEHFRLITYGAVMLGCLYVMPQGIVGAAAAWGRRQASAPAAESSRSLQAAWARAKTDDPPPRVAPAPTAAARDGIEPLVCVEDVTKRFGGLEAVAALSLQIHEGTVHSVIGPNGAGKTTLVNLLSGLYRPTHGEIFFAGHRITDLPAHRRSTLGIARTFQTTRPFPRLSVVENVMVGLHTHLPEGLGASLAGMPTVRRLEDRARSEALGMLAFARLEADPEARAGSLPFGHQRLLEIARALAARPRLLLLDEPAAGLTSWEVAACAELIGRIRGLGVTVLLIEHHMELVMGISDRVTVLDYGREIAAGLPQEIQVHPQVVEAYLGSDD